MDTPAASFLLACAALAAPLLLVRAWLTRRGSGQLAQVAFRRRHGAQVASLLAGELDPRRGSPWIAIEVDGRPARMVAAPIGDGWLQAGIELHGHPIAVDVFHTSGDVEELGVPGGVDVERVLELAAQLRDCDVDSVARPVPGALPIMRMRFRAVDELPERVARVAPLLAQLEALTRNAPGTPDS